jgi:hypothetical protein
MNRQHNDEPKDFIDWALVLAIVFGFAAGLVDIRILRGHSWPLVVRVVIAGGLMLGWAVLLTLAIYHLYIKRRK